MSVLSDLREAFTRVKARSAGADTPGPDEALDKLRPRVVASLAAYAGYELEELDAYFELLPIGTRFELEQVGAVRLLDTEGGERLGLKVLPFAVPLVNAARNRVVAIRAEGDQDELVEALASARAEQALEVPLSPIDRSTDVADDVVGTVQLQAATVDVDEEAQRGWVRVLAPTGDATHPHPLALFPFSLRLAERPLHKGQLANVTLAVSQRREKGVLGKKPARSRDEIAVSLHDGLVTVAPRDAGKTNAIARVTAVTALDASSPNAV